MTEKPLAIDLYAGLGGWTDGLIAEGYRVVGFDIEAHDYGDGKRYPAQLVIQDVLTIHGRQFKDAALIVASPPCQEFSYMAMPWSRAKAIAAEYRSGKREVKKLRALFDACFRIQREAIEAAGHFIPLVVENVRGAQPWVGKARWNFGSYYLWGDVPALMPITMPRRKSKVGSWGLARENYNSDKSWDDGQASFHAAEHEASVQRYEHFKSQGMNWSNRSIKGQDFTRVAGRQAEGIKHGGDCFSDPAWDGKQGGVKTVGHLNKRDGHTHARHLTNQAEHGVKQAGLSGLRENGKGDAWFQDGMAKSRSKINARKAASAAIAKIPLPLARWIARTYKPKHVAVNPS